MYAFVMYLWRFNRWGALAGLALIMTLCVLAAIAPAITSWESATSIELPNALQPPSAAYVLGSDEMGRSVLSRLIWGGRYTLLIALGSVFAGVVFGLLLGVAAAYTEGVFSTALVRLIDALIGFPRVLVAIVMITIFGAGVTGLTLAIAIASAPLFARMYYIEVARLRHREYVEAARSLGASRFWIIWHHILPNTISVLIVQVSVSLAEAVLLASGLSFLGLGPQPPTPEWGAMIASGRAHIFSSPHLIWAPGAALFAIIMAFNVLGDALRDFLDPKFIQTHGE